DPTTYFNFFYITPDRLLFNAYGLIYVVAIPLLLVISYFMYKKRDLERCGEAVVFPKLKTFFIYFAGLMGGIFSYFYFSIWSFKSIIFMLPFGIAAVIVANMINKRGITLKGALSHTLIFTACVLVILGAFHFDITGFEKRIPGNIESVTVIPDRYSRYMDEDTLKNYVITDVDDIEKVVTYHRSKIEGEHSEDGYLPSNVDILYKLKNGRTLKRTYEVNFADEKEFFESVAKIDKVKSVLYPIYDMPSDIEIVNIYLNNFLSSAYFYPDGKIFAELMTAMQEDIKNISYEENAALLWHSMFCDAPLYADIEYKSPESDKPYNLSYYFPISFGFTKTMEVLKKYGYYDRFMTVNYIDMVGIDRDSDRKGDLTLSDWNVDEIITDKKEMADILEMLQTSYRKPYASEADPNFDEYIFLDQYGSTHTTSISTRTPKKVSK
ncbi:MAG: hypothetical protein IKR46_03015, partial [Clostridia bacterium]|nr:hypothetical protein [Clostridia bacterium]